MRGNHIIIASCICRSGATPFPSQPVTEPTCNQAGLQLHLPTSLLLFFLPYSCSSATLYPRLNIRLSLRKKPAVSSMSAVTAKALIPLPSVGRAGNQKSQNKQVKGTVQPTPFI